MIVGVVLSNLKDVDQNNPRNNFIVGFAIFNSMSIAGPGGYFSTLTENPFGSSDAAAIALSIFSSPMIIAFIITLTLDNTVGGATDKQRGLYVWQKAANADIYNDKEYIETYSLPLFFAKAFRNCGYLEYLSRSEMPRPPADGQYHQSRGDVGELCCPCLFRKGEEEKQDGMVEDRVEEKGDSDESLAPFITS